MDVESLLKQSRVTEALTKAEDAVRADPAGPQHRVLLAQLLAILGRWDRSLAQFEVAAKLDPKNLLMAQVFRQAILCERLREEVFAGVRTPLLLGEPEPWIGPMVQALALTAAGQHAAAAEQRSAALEMAPASSGTIQGQPFEWIADADSRLGPLLEVFVDGRYYWAPMSRVHMIKVPKPENLADLVWTPAQFVWSSGGAQAGFLPTRYVGVQDWTDGGLLLAKKTEWADVGDGRTYLGRGQRMLATDTGEYPILEAGHVIIGPRPPEVGEVGLTGGGPA